MCSKHVGEVALDAALSGASEYFLVDNFKCLLKEAFLAELEAASRRTSLIKSGLKIDHITYQVAFDNIFLKSHKKV